MLETATSGRSRCRACGAAIGQAALRFGERIPNPFGDGEATLWFHPRCAAFRRPEPLLEVLADPAATIDGRDELLATARLAAAHRRLPRIAGAERASSGRAKCRSCREPIARAGWRVRLVFWEDGRFTPGGFVHLACCPGYFETDAFAAAVRHFSGDLDDAARAELAVALGG